MRQMGSFMKHSRVTESVRAKLKVFVAISVLFAGVILFGGYGAGSAFANSDGAAKACEGLQTLGVECDSTSGSAQDVASGPIKTVVRLLSFLVGVACVLMIIYGAFRIVTSGGNSDSVKSGRTTIIYALVGLVLVLLANVIVSFTYKQAKDIESGASSSSNSTNSTARSGGATEELEPFED